MTPTTSLWLTIVGMGIITFGLRAASMLMAHKLPASPWLRSFLRYVPIAVLTAIVFPELITPGGVMNLSPISNPRLAAGIVALLVAWQTKKALPTILAGMAALWLFMHVM